jgi:sugar phosphate isomerase/epimerase
VVEGEEFALGARMVRSHLKCVALKDVLVTRDECDGHGKEKRSWLESGQGMVDWTSVFTTLREIDFDGPVSVHCEFECEEDERDEAIKREVGFFRKFVPKA